ncbi:zinc-dependent alcohol dehydrogenase family protein [Chromobacterium subtsugae]|uniref:zinc-dependent alcohol dehydrogenase family protein n=1 Tax=Chromobacterium subtsugae TaxID=251747 RepID=UPI00064144DE|nr:NAD(P)-dependent alcohol dehydrogenase [Chromobacterium subtsugae]
MKIHRFDAQGQLRLAEAPLPQPGPGEVRLKVEALSLNYRDLLIEDAARAGQLPGRVPVSDATGAVDALGEGVSGWQIGQKAAAAFFRDWVDGRFRLDYLASSWGGQFLDGMLTEYIVAPAAALVAAPTHLSSEEAAALPCAGVTAWHGLVARGGLQAGDTLLIHGTGGVALFGLQIASALGARTIVLSSSDAKLARAKALGASDGINYRAVPDWDKAVRELTGGEGVSHVLELGGPGTYQRSLDALAAGGTLVQIGVLSGFGPQPNLGRLQTLNADIAGVMVGSARHLAELGGFLAEHGLHPVIDRVFDFDDAPAAYAYLRAAGHFGKVALRVGG